MKENMNDLVAGSHLIRAAGFEVGWYVVTLSRNKAKHHNTVSQANQSSMGLLRDFQCDIVSCVGPKMIFD